MHDMFFVAPQSYTVNIFLLVLMVVFQLPEYSTPEDAGLSVCLTVTNGKLAPEVTVSALLNTAPVNLAGNYSLQ